jgi:tetratricopeptide (TPR) repeat protein
MAVRLVDLELLEAAGRTAEALEASREAVRIDPTAEPAHRALMRLLAAAGDRAGAIRQYHACRDELRRELDVEPGPETEALHRRILEEGIADREEATVSSGEVSLIEELADATRRAGEADRSAVLYEEALGRALGTGDGASAQRLRGKAALANIVRGDLAAASNHLISARRAYAGMMPEAYSAALLHYLLAQLRWHGGRYDEALQAAEHAAEAARRNGDARGEAEACEVLALSCHALGDWRRGIEAELRRQELAVDDGFDVGLALEGHLCLWEYHLYGDRPYGIVEDSVRAALARAEAVGNVLAMSVCEHALGALHFVGGRWRDATDELGRSVRLANAVGAELAAIVGMQRLGRLQTAKGDLAEGLASLELAAAAANEARHPPTPRHSRTRILASLAQNRLQAGDLDEAVRYVGEALAAQSEFGRCVTCDALLGPVAISVSVASGDLDAARRFAAEVDRTAVTFGSRAWMGTADLGRAMVLLADRAAVPAFLEAGRAAASFVEVGQPYDRARALAVRAAAMEMIGTGSASELAEQIRGEAAELFGSLGADPDPDRLDRLLEPA